MEDFLQATVIGLATASILAVAASGLVLTYTTTGIFNFAHGAVGMLGAFAYWQLRVGWSWPAPLALLVVLGLLAPLVGVLLETVIMRGLTDAPEPARVVVTISLLIASLGIGLWVWPLESRPIMPFWGRGSSVELAGVNVTYHQIAAFIIALVLALGLRLLLFTTRAGVAMRAAVDDRPLAMLNGARPDRAAMLAWAIGCSCAALAGVLMAPTTGMSHLPLTLLIVNAYAAAMIGRLRNLPMTFLGALLLGLASSYVLEYAPSEGILNRSGFRFALPAITLFTVLMVMRPVHAHRRALSRVRENIPKPNWGGAWVTALAFVGAAVYLANTVGEDTDLLRISRILGLAIIALSLVPLVGFGGQLSLCQMSFAGVGALVMAHHGAEGQPIALLYAALAAGAVGALVAIPAIRLGGLYFALATAAFAVVLDEWVFKLAPFELGPFDITLFTSGTASAEPVDLPVPSSLFGLELPATTTPRGLLVTMAVVFALLYLLVVGIRRSTFGHRLLAMKESPAAASTLGMNLVAIKFAVFTLSAAMAGLGGALYTGTVATVGPEEFAFVTSLPLLLLAVVGGIASAAGALFAGIMIEGMRFVIDAWPWFEDFSQVLPGLMGITLGRSPNGAVEEIRAGFAPLKKNRLALAVTVVSTAVVLVLRWFEVLTGYPYLVALIAAALSGGLLLRYVESRATRRRDRAEAGLEVDLEWVGIDRPFTPDDAAALERRLGVELEVR